MLKFIHIADVGGVFWAIVMVIWIITQIKKAAKNTPRPPSSNADPSSPYVAPQKEIEDFLASLAGTTKSTPKSTSVTKPRVQTPPPPAPSRVWQQTAQAKTKTKQRRYQPQPEPTPQAYVAPTPPVQKTEIKDIHAEAYAEKPETVKQSVLHLAKDLSNRNSLKTAIVLREILGPPLALKRR